MEWWNRSDYEPVDELSKATYQKAFNRRMARATFGLDSGYSGKTDKAQTRNALNYHKKIGTSGMALPMAGSVAARTAMAAGAAYGAYKGGKALYNKFKKRNKGEEPEQPAHIKGSANTKRGGYSEFEGNGKVRECGTNCESWDWTDDPGAQQIMEAYFSEFADADITEY